MDDIERALSQVPGGLVLDVATGRGTFITSLFETLPGIQLAIGIDPVDRAVRAARQAVDRPDVCFVQMDGSWMGFAGSAFDVVAISNSLHHLANPPQVLHEIRRVLKPGGYFILSEMYCDHQAETQQSHVLLHHWWGEIDTALGIVHNPTYTRQRLTELAHTMGLRVWQDYDWKDLSSDPKDAELVQYINGVIDQYQQRADSLPEAGRLQQQGEVLRRRVGEIGLHWASGLVLVGQK